MAREEVHGLAGKCLMVTAGVPTEEERKEPNLKEDKCFAAKPMSEKINDYDRLIKRYNPSSKLLKLPSQIM